MGLGRVPSRSPGKLEGAGRVPNRKLDSNVSAVAGNAGHEPDAPCSRRRREGMDAGPDRTSLPAWAEPEVCKRETGETGAEAPDRTPIAGPSRPEPDPRRYRKLAPGPREVTP